MLCDALNRTKYKT